MQKRALGRGLEALLGSPAGSDVEPAVMEVPLEQVHPNPYQPRRSFDPAKLIEMVASVREHGILQPVLVRRAKDGRYELIAGERRVRAARECGLKTVPAIVREYTDAQMLEVALIENLQREDITAIEAAYAYKRLRDEFGLTQEEIAKRVGKSPSAVANTLRILGLPQAIQDGLARGEITEGHARALLQAPREAQVDAFLEVKRRGLSVRECERLTRALSARKPAPPVRRDFEDQPFVTNANDAAVMEVLQSTLGTKVFIRRMPRAGRIEIEFYSEEHLEALVERILRSDGRFRSGGPLQS
ncbi:MAG: ParB/RepB/Spo0J family partition protein [Chthonomonadales bacterium]